MTGASFLAEFGVVVICAALVSVVAQRFGAPSVVSYVLAGLLLGPVSGIMEGGTSTDGIAAMGLLLMLFGIAAELRPETTGHVARTALVASIVQIAFSAGGGLLLCLLLGFSTPEAYVIAAALTISSAVVVVNGLSPSTELAKQQGTTAVGVVVVQNVLALGVLALLASTGADDTAAAESRGGLMRRPLIGLIVFTILAMIVGRLLQPRLTHLMSSLPDLTLVWALAWCFGAAAAATWLNLHPAAGAYVAGLSLAGVRNRGNLRHSLRPVVQISFVMFFTTQGVLVDVAAIGEHALALIVLSLFVLVGKSLVVLSILCRVGYGALAAWRASVAVSQVGELAFVLAAVACSAGLIRSSASSLIVAAGLLTICASLTVTRYADRSYVWLSGTGALELLVRSHQRTEG